MGYVEAPDEWNGEGVGIFLAGGITDCPDWQAEARCIITGDVTLLNPRRANFPIHDPDAAPAQIEWEFRHLHWASVVLFWFAGGSSLQPIALYELGRHAALDRAIAVGVDRDYRRAIDVRLQMALARPEVVVYDSLEATCMQAVLLANAAGLLT